MSAALKQKIDELFQATKDLMSFEEIKPHCEQFNEWINTQTSYQKNSLGSHLSRNGFYKQFKSIPLEQGKNAELVAKHNADGSVKGHELKHYVLTLCGLTKEDWEEVNNTSRVTDRLSNEGIEIKPSEYIDITSKLLESDDPHELAVGLIAATGRRPHEILARGKFTPIEGESYQAMFEGQGKKRGEKPVFKIFTLFPASYIIQRLRVLRKDTQPLIKEVSNEFPTDITAQNSAIESRRGNSLRRVVQEYFGGKETEKPLLNFRHGQDQNDCKALRAACSVLITARECNGSLGAKLLFASRFLGHITETEKPTDRDLQHIATTVGYSDYYVNESVDYPLAPEKIKPTNVKIQPEDLDRVKELQEQWDCSQHEIVTRLLDRNDEVLRLQKQLIEAQNKITELEELLNTQAVESPEEKVISKNTNWENMTSEELKKHRSQEAVEEKINRAFLAMTNHNDKVATDNSQRWYIGNTSLRELSGCNGQNVASWLENHKTLVEDHNKKFGLGQYHNKCHIKNKAALDDKGKVDINRVITW